MIAHRDFRLLGYFVAVVRAGSIRLAASRLSVSPAVVSEALAQLEEILGITLLRRTTRSMELTAAGRNVFEPAAEMVAAAEEAMQRGTTAAQKPSGILRVTVSGELCLSWLPTRLRAFEMLAPSVHVEVDIDDSPVDLTSSDYDLAIRASFSLAPEGVENAIDYLPLECVCSGERATKTENLRRRLMRIGVIGFPGPTQGHRNIVAVARGRAARRPSSIPAPCRFRTRDHVAAHRLALEGFGAALLMAPTVADDLQEGRLVRVSEQHTFGFAALRLVVRDRHPTAATREFCRILEG